MLYKQICKQEELFIGNKTVEPRHELAVIVLVGTTSYWEPVLQISGSWEEIFRWEHTSW